MRQRDDVAIPSAQEGDGSKTASALDKEQALARSRFRRASFAYGRRNDLTKLLRHRHGGACDTDDAELWFETVLPFLVEATVLNGRPTLDDALTWSRANVPTFVDAVGVEHIAGRTAQVMEQRRIAAKDWSWGDGPLKWVPLMPELVRRVRITRAENEALGLRGWGSIDPLTEEERQDRHRRGEERRRREKGARPRSEQTKTRDAEADADCLGITRRTLENWMKAGTFTAMVRARLDAGKLDFQKPCLPSTVEKYGAHEFWKSVEAANDDEPVVVVPDPEGSGFTGAHVTISASEVRTALSRFPDLRADLHAHLAAIDAAMAKTGAPYRKVVLKNLWRDRSKLARKQKRAAGKAAA